MAPANCSRTATAWATDDTTRRRTAHARPLDREHLRPEDRHEDGHAPPPGGGHAIGAFAVALAKPRARCTGSRSRRTLSSSRPVPQAPTPCPRVRAVAPPRTSREPRPPRRPGGSCGNSDNTPTPPAHPGQRQHQLVRGDQAPITFDHPNAPAMRPRESESSPPEHPFVPRLVCGSAAIGMVDWRRYDARPDLGVSRTCRAPSSV